MSKQLRSFSQSFRYAAAGLLHCYKTQRNFRFHVVAACYVLFFSAFYDFTAAEISVLFLAIVLVLAAEAINTAVEALTDLCTEHRFDRLAKVAKDAAAGGVLITAAGSVFVGVMLFYRPPVLNHIFLLFTGNPFAALALVLSLIIAFFVVFAPRTDGRMFPRRGNRPGN